ncbi:hypothetical protein MMC17_000714 [Xylographa soralifera]|nr:hypothetical protein [Xylographa soralifera]
MFYRRVTEYNDIDPRPPAKSKPFRPRNVTISFGVSPFSHITNRRDKFNSQTELLSVSKKRKLDVLVDDVKHFRRVRIISRKDRLKAQPAIQRLFGGYSNSYGFTTAKSSSDTVSKASSDSDFRKVHELTYEGREGYRATWAHRRDTEQDSGDEEDTEDPEDVDVVNEDHDDSLKDPFPHPIESWSHLFGNQFSELAEDPYNYNLKIFLHFHSIHEKDASGLTALHYAASRHKVDIARFLLLRGANAMAQTNIRRQMPLHLAVLNNDYNMVVLLLYNSATYSARDIDGCNALHLAVVAADMAIVEVLVGQGITIDGRDNSGRTPLHVATSEGKGEIIKLLLQHGADPQLQDFHKKTAKDYAVEGKQDDIVAMFDQTVPDMASVALPEKFRPRLSELYGPFAFLRPSATQRWEH